MTRAVALLRGINVGGHRKVPMAELRDVFVAELGFDDVATYIQSGNVVFSAPGDGAPEVGPIEAAVERRFGFTVDVILRTADELRAAQAGLPLADAHTAHLHVGFLTDEPPVGWDDELDPGGYEPERWAVAGKHLYLDLPNGMARTKVVDHVTRRLGVAATLRNWRTVTKLTEML